MTPIVAIDCETTGIHPGRQVYEIAMIRRDDAGQLETSFFVDVDLSQADPFGLQVGRFYERHPHGRFLSGLPVGKWKELSQFSRQRAAELVAICTHGAHLVGAVPNFDTETLAPLLREFGILPAWHYHLIDVENLAVGYLAGQGSVYAPPWHSDELSRACGVELAGPEEQHTALGDARWALRLYDAIMGTGS